MYSDMYVQLIIFIFHLLFTILEIKYLSTYKALENGSPLIEVIVTVIGWKLRVK